MKDYHSIPQYYFDFRGVGINHKDALILARDEYKKHTLKLKKEKK